MFSGSFSLLPSSGSGGGGGGTFSLLPSSGSTGTTGAPSYSYAVSQPGYTYITAPSYSYSQLPATAYVLPGAGRQAGPFGERGPYTPLDFPLMNELAPGERLENLNPRSGMAGNSVLPYLALGVIIALLVKK